MELPANPAPAAERAAYNPDIRYRRWVFTFNNYSEADETAIQSWSRPTYTCYGREVGAQGTPHLQGLFILKDACKWSTLRAKFPNMWMEPMKGTFEQAFDYCTKDDDNPFEVGTRPEPKGKAGGEANQKNWEEAKTLAMAGKVDDIAANVYIPFYKNLLSIATKHQSAKENLEQPCGIWYWGATGTGKSHAARSEFGASIYLKGPHKWWDGYDGQDNVLIEDVDVTHAYLGFYLKIWADKYYFQAEVKGSSIVLRPKQIVVTSNCHPSKIWHDEETLLPIMRRFKVTRFACIGDLTPSRNSDWPAEEVRGAYVPGFVPPPVAIPRIVPAIPEDDVNDFFADLDFLLDEGEAPVFGDVSYV